MGTEDYRFFFLLFFAACMMFPMIVGVVHDISHSARALVICSIISRVTPEEDTVYFNN